MSTGYQIDGQYGTYFITPTVADWVDVFEWVERAEDYVYSSAKALMLNTVSSLPLADWYGKIN